MADFPSICPVSRRFKAAQFPTKRFTSISGAGTTRLYGSKGFDATLDVQFLVDDEHLISNHRQLGRQLWHVSSDHSPRCSGCQQW